MKKKDILFAVIVLAAAGLAWLFMHMTAKDAAQLKITVDGKLYGTYDLNQNQEIRIQDTNVCRIQDGVVTMTEADCPDQICVHTAEISMDGGTIVCLPNRVVLEILSENPEQMPDTISS